MVKTIINSKIMGIFKFLRMNRICKFTIKITIIKIILNSNRIKTKIKNSTLIWRTCSKNQLNKISKYTPISRINNTLSNNSTRIKWCRKEKINLVILSSIVNNNPNKNSTRIKWAFSKDQLNKKFKNFLNLGINKSNIYKTQ